MKDYEFAQTVVKIYQSCPTKQAHQKALELKSFLDNDQFDLSKLVESIEVRKCLKK